MEQQRVFLAVALSMGVIFVWSYLFPPPEPEFVEGQGGQVTEGDQAGSQGASAQGANAQGGAQADAKAPSKPLKDIPKREDLVIETDNYKAVFTNEGGRLKGFELRKPQQYQPRGDLMMPVPDSEGVVNPNWVKYLPFGLQATGQLPHLTEMTMYEVVRAENNQILLRHEVPELYKLEKLFTVDEKFGSLKMLVTVTNLSKLQISDEIELIVYGHQPAGSGGWSIFNPLPDVTESICYGSEEATRAPREEMEDVEPVAGPVVWGGVDSRYFITSVMNAGQPFAGCKFSLMEEEFFKTEMSMASLSLAPGETRSWDMQTYIGPKLVEAMTPYNIELEESIDYGFFAVLSRPIRWGLVLFYGFVGNWGLAIIFLTIALRMLLFPLNHYGYKSMEGMRKVAPLMEKIKADFPDDPERQQREILKLYQENGVNPFGCLPTFLQIPIFFALYRTIYSSVELYHAKFYFWYTDLSAPDPYYVLPILVGVVMVGQQALMPQTQTNPQMKYMMWGLPIMFSFFTFVLPSGLALYILVSVGLGIAQQYYIRRTMDSSKGGDDDGITDAEIVKA